MKILSLSLSLSVHAGQAHGILTLCCLLAGGKASERHKFGFVAFLLVFLVQTAFNLVTKGAPPSRFALRANSTLFPVLQHYLEVTVVL